MDDEELHELVADIDKDLQDLGVPMFRRPVEAIVEFQCRTGTQEPVYGTLPYPDASKTHAQRISL